MQRSGGDGDQVRKCKYTLKAGQGQKQSALTPMLKASDCHRVKRGHSNRLAQQHAMSRMKRANPAVTAQRLPRYDNDARPATRWEQQTANGATGQD